jgi:nucleoside-diphosphate-sugar epimerase
MKALVTGGTGFIGSHLVERLLAAGHETRVLVRDKAKGDWLRQRGAELSSGDVTDRASLARATEGIDTVLHCAAYVTDWGRWHKFQAVTVDGTKNLLSAAASAGVSRFLHVSTATVYDDQFSRRARIITEDAPHGERGDRAYGNYSRAKVLAERLVWQSHREGQIAATVVRPTWVYGPRDFTILPRLIDHLKGPLACWIGRDDPVVDPIYVTDVAECAYLAATKERAAGQAYNVAPPEQIRLRQFLGALCRELNIPLPGWSLPYGAAYVATKACETWAHLIGAKNAPSLTASGLASFTVDQHFDPGKAIAELNWRPQIDLEEGARRTAAWFTASASLPNPG